jgi:hypothetical protein
MLPVPDNGWLSIPSMLVSCHSVIGWQGGRHGSQDIPRRKYWRSRWRAMGLYSPDCGIREIEHGYHSLFSRLA